MHDSFFRPPHGAPFVIIDGCVECSVEDILAEAHRFLRHQRSIELAGATILAAIGATAVKAQAFDAIAQLFAKP
jgi:hypothetical protein